MPYPNMPKSKWDEMERCVAELTPKHGKDSAHAMCYSSIMGKHKKDKAGHTRKALRRIADRKK